MTWPGDQVFGLFLDLDIAVADHAEQAARLDLEIREQVVQHQPDQVLERHMARRVAGQTDETGQLVGQADQRIERIAPVRLRQLQRDRQAQIGDEGEGMRRIDRNRRQDGEHLFHEMPVEPGKFGGAQRARIDDADAARLQIGLQAPPGIELGIDQVAGALVDRAQLFGRRQAVLARRGHAGLDLPFQPGDPDHVEFVQIARGNGQEPQALEQRMIRIVRLFHDPLVEGEPGKLPVDEPPGIGRRNAFGVRNIVSGVGETRVAVL